MALYFKCESAARGIAVGRKSWLFADPDRGGGRAAAIYTQIGAAKLNGIDSRARIADVLRKITDQPALGLRELLPWIKQRPATLAVA